MHQFSVQTPLFASPHHSSSSLRKLTLARLMKHLFYNPTKSHLWLATTPCITTSTDPCTTPTQPTIKSVQPSHLIKFSLLMPFLLVLLAFGVLLDVPNSFFDYRLLLSLSTSRIRTFLVFFWHRLIHPSQFQLSHNSKTQTCNPLSFNSLYIYIHWSIHKMVIDWLIDCVAFVP